MTELRSRTRQLSGTEWVNGCTQIDQEPEKGKAGTDFDLNRTEIRRQLDASVSDTNSPNPPLPFTLKGIDPGHPYLVHRGVSRGLAEYFGVGFFAGNGSMRNRIVIPIHNDGGELVAYAGRTIDDEEPRYKLPRGFHKGCVLFNLHRVSHDGQCRRVIIVEGFFDCIRLVEAGFVNTVALMGTSLSEHQERLLRPFAEIVLMLDGDEPGRNAAGVLLTRLARRHFVRVVDVPGQPDACPLGQLQLSSPAPKPLSSFTTIKEAVNCLSEN